MDERGHFDQQPPEAGDVRERRVDLRGGASREDERRAPDADEVPLPPLGDDRDIEEKGAALLHDRRRIAGLVAAVVLLVVAIYVVLPKVVGLNDTVARIGNATWYWVVVAAAFNAVSFVAYATLFRRVLGAPVEASSGRGGGDPGGMSVAGADVVARRLDLRASYEITMAGFAATILFSAAGAGGVALTYWALRKAGLARRRAACRMVAFLVLLYTVYAGALLIFGVLLRTGVLPGRHPAGGTIVPAAVAAVLLVGLGLVSLIPADIGRRMTAIGARPSRLSRRSHQLARAPATVATGVRTALWHMRHPRRSALTLLGAIGWWAGNIGILWASFQAFGVEVRFGVLVMGYFVGMVANLAPSPAAGVGTVDAGLIGAFVLFGIPAETVFPAVLVFRLVGFWLPIPVGVWAYILLRRTVGRWAQEPEAATIQSKVIAEAT